MRCFNPREKGKGMRQCWKSVVALIIGGATLSLGAEEAKPEMWSFGGDLRLRYDGANNLPTEKWGEKGHTDYARVRTRLWGKFTTDRLVGFVRVADEFRYYRSPEKDKGKQRFPDEVFIDNLYFLLPDLFGVVDVKVGRQDMAFGAKRIICDGTGGDGSRSSSFDAVRLTFKLGEGRTLDAFGVYQAREDWMPVLGKTHDAKSKHTKGYSSDYTGYNQNEYGAGLYYTDKSWKTMPWELYAVWKVEEGEHSKAIAEGDSFTTYTVGTRLLPRFTKALSGEFELAAQTGTDSLLAAQVYGGLTYAFEAAWKPKVTLAVQALSGDKDGWRGKHAWHAVFNRETGVGEAVVPMFHKYAYTNFVYPHVKATFTPGEGQALTLQAGPMFAPVRESLSSGEETGRVRGLYAAAKYSLNLQQVTGADWLKGVGLAFTGEWLSKGDAFDSGSDGTALFGRMEVTYRF